MSEEKKPKKKASKVKKLVILGAALAVLGGGGAAGGFYVAGGFKEVPGKKEDFNRPQFVLKGENPEEIGNAFAAKAHGDDSNAGHGVKPARPVTLPAPRDPSHYQATYFQIPAPFTSNLTDSDSFAQVSIAVSTYYDNRVIQAVTAHEMAIRSAILLMMAQETELELSTPAGKEHLQTELKKIINGVLRDKTGYDGVDNVYFTNFVIQ